MGKQIISSSVFLLVLAFSSNLSNADQNTKVDAALKQFASGQLEVESIKVLGVLDNPKAAFEKAPQKYHRSSVIQFLKYNFNESFRPLALFLSQHPEGKGHITIEEKNKYWVSNSFSATVTPTGLKLLSQAPGLLKIYANRKIETIEPSEKRKARGSSRDEFQISSYGRNEIGLDQLIKDRPELTGKGVTLGVVDTGVDATHPALKGRVQKFFDGEAHAVGEPQDFDTHGTHVCGTVAGGDRESMQIGIAPQAQLIVAGVLNGYDQMLQGMQFMIDPDGNPKTADAPRAINNSWHAPGAPDIELFYRAVASWEAAGILPVFAAGNSGPYGKTIGRPQVHPSSFAVGATGEDGLIARFSSRGPGVYNNTQTQKPEITAPGVNIPSSIPGGQFEEMSGTSMASPHVTGAVGLLYQMDPSLTPAQVKALLIKTATPMTEDGKVKSTQEWNKVYGFGKLNVARAVKALISIHQHMNALVDGKTDFLSGLFTSPKKIELSNFFAPAPAMQASDFELPVSLEVYNDAWVSASEL